MKTLKKNNKIPNIIHQVFFDVGLGKGLKDFPIYQKSHNQMKDYCKKNKYKYYLWTKPMIIKLIKKYYGEKELNYYNKLPTEWYRMELSRYYVVAVYGGYYLDLDIFFNYKKDKDPFKILLNKIKKEKLDYIVISHFDRYWKSGGKALYSENHFFGFKPKVLNELLKYSKKEYQEKSKIEIYKTWKVRLMLQTVGVKMWARFIKLKKYKRLEYISHPKDKLILSKKDTINYNKSIFIDFATAAWLKKKKGGGKWLVGDNTDDLVLFRTYLGEYFNDIFTWRGTIPSIYEPAGSVRGVELGIDEMQQSRVNDYDGWVIDAWEFRAQFANILGELVYAWEYDLEQFNEKLAVARRFIFLLNRGDLRHWLRVEMGPGNIINAHTSYIYNKTLIIEVLKNKHVTIIQPYSGRIYKYDNIFPTNITFDFWKNNNPQQVERRRELLQIIDPSLNL